MAPTPPYVRMQGLTKWEMGNGKLIDRVYNVEPTPYDQALGQRISSFHASQLTRHPQHEVTGLSVPTVKDDILGLEMTASDIAS